MSSAGQYSPVKLPNTDLSGSAVAGSSVMDGKGVEVSLEAGGETKTEAQKRRFLLRELR